MWWFSSSEKDVNRTDRTNKFYEGQDNPGLILLHDILMTYCMYDFDLGKFSSKVLILKDVNIFTLEFTFLIQLDMANSFIGLVLREFVLQGTGNLQGYGS